jgi:hypothetical protein
MDHYRPRSVRYDMRMGNQIRRTSRMEDLAVWFQDSDKGLLEAYIVYTPSLETIAQHHPNARMLRTLHR